jgi:hypothetical protein
MKDTELKKEVRDTINQLVKKIMKDNLDELNAYKKEIGTLCLTQANLNSKLANDLAALQNSVHAHSVGVQNVYNEMQEFKKHLDIK